MSYTKMMLVPYKKDFYNIQDFSRILKNKKLSNSEKLIIYEEALKKTKTLKTSDPIKNKEITNLELQNFENEPIKSPINELADFEFTEIPPEEELPPLKKAKKHKLLEVIKEDKKLKETQTVDSKFLKAVNKQILLAKKKNTKKDNKKKLSKLTLRPGVSVNINSKTNDYDEEMPDDEVDYGQFNVASLDPTKRSSRKLNWKVF